ncbi:MAG: dihydrofolate reductase family protein [Candidatus Rickettsia vulgarisii]
MNGKSIEMLKNAGIQVIIGELQQQALELNEIFFHYMQYNRPFVIAKWAMTIDGKIATSNFDSKWITGDKARKNAH